ncbi:TrbG/VirB9 family P-type conjugative transfer protein [Pantoea sp. B9002]|uniref:TrbG/VirB9 family P-type conjugative transfer protein n=1 Tax=Pantoea sp. B9002 TaxID=2726979 RepID=UPI0015A23FFC|nr:TrbG/VirB9 family P-type conjugative transfer protein [Pantoea sp. B9002]NWA64066.1 TrbG/VirB9 family P-type conjugative transfer protein [Pantoea sp. B9002]
MKKLSLLAVTVAMLSTGNVVYAAQCKFENWKPGKVITVNTAIGLGTRIQLPAPLQTAPVNSNDDLWNVEGAQQQIVAKPNSQQPEGAAAMVYAFLADGSSVDIQLTRVPQAQNTPCVIINGGNRYITNNVANGLQAYQNNQMQMGAMQAQQNQVLQNQLREERENSQQSVVKALNRYRYHIYTRYNWDKGEGFVGKDVISDVYDDGRFTYIRLSRTNRGLLSVEADVGGKNAIVPLKFDEDTGIYQVTGIYPKFTMKLDDVKINVSRVDNATKGAS